jgi:hypothetical protein
MPGYQIDIQMFLIFFAVLSFFSNYTIHRRHSQRTHTHPYEYTHANPTPRSIFTTGASLSTGTSPTTESTNVVKF